MNKRPRSLDDDNRQLQDLSDADLEDLMAMSFAADATAGDEAAQMEPGSTITATVIAFEEDDVLVEFGKNTGLIAKSEFGGQLPDLGDRVEGTFERFDQRREAAVIRVGHVVRRLFIDTARVGMVVEGVVDEINRGGLILSVKGQRAFMPISQIELFHVDDLSDYAGRRLEGEITQINHDRAEIVVSRRAVLSRKRDEHRLTTMHELTEGQEVEGVVMRVNEHGAFIDVGGCDGLLHASKLRQAGKTLEVGQRVAVEIASVDVEGGRVGLDLKSSESAGFEAVAEEMIVGETMTVLVSRLRDEGAYVLLDDDVEGLIPAAQLASRKPRAGSLVKAVVKAIDTERKIVMLDLK